MNNNFSIVEFNKLIDGGDLGALEYIKKTMLDNLHEDLYKMNRVDYLKSLYDSVISLNTCVVATEQCSDATKIYGIFDKYAELRDLLFKEFDIYYDYDKNKYCLKKESDK